MEISISSMKNETIKELLWQLYIETRACSIVVISIIYCFMFHSKGFQRALPMLQIICVYTSNACMH